MTGLETPRDRDLSLENYITGCSKRPTESYADFVHFMSMQFDRWVKSEEVTDFESLKQLILKEQFNDKVSQDIKERLIDREFKTVMALARAADEYAAVHKSGTRQVHSKLGAGNKVNQTTDFKSNANNKVMSSDSSGVFNVNDDRRAALAQQQSQHAGFFNKPSVNTNRVQCWYCQGAHFKRDCPKIKGDQTNTVSFVKSFCSLKPKADVSDYVYPVTVKGIEGGDDVVLQCWRDTGAQISCLREGSVPDSHLTATGRFVPVIGVANSEIAEVPEYKIMVESDIVNGEMLVGLTPRSFGMPNATVPFLLGNDFGPKLMLSSMVGAVTTRRQARLLQAQTLSDSQVDGSHETMSDATGDKQEGDDVDVSTEVDDVHLNSVVECVRNLFDNATVAQGEGIDRPMSNETVSCVKSAEMQKQDSSLNDVFSIVNELGESSACVGSVMLGVPLCSVSVADADEDGVREEPCLLSTPLPTDYVKLLEEKTAHLDPKRAKHITTLVDEYSCVISDKPGLTNLCVHHISVKPAVLPIRQKQYRISPKHQAILRGEIDKLLNEGVIEPSSSEWSSPVILVPKPGGAVRCVLDLRAVNKVIVDECYPMPRIDDLIDRIGQAKFLTKMDLSSSFHQIALDKESRQYTSFSTPFGQFQYTRLPFGLKTSPLKFSYVMDKALSDLYRICGMYIDDIVVSSMTWEDHLQDVRLVLQRLEKAKLTVRLTKCFFAVQEVDYLGHTVGIGQMSPRQIKVKALLDSPRPVNKKYLKSFLGLAGFYQRYVPHYGNLTAPLTDLLRKDRPFVWGQTEEECFNNIKNCLCSSPVLLIADYSKPFVLMVDASQYACGAALMQEDAAGSLRPVCYFSRKFNDAQKNYTVRDREALGLVLAVRAFKVYVSSGPVVVYTDHEPLKYINSMATTNQRILRWALELQPYQLIIRHVKGKDNVIADYLSRPCLPVDL
jgi:hypothetical protein